MENIGIVHCGLLNCNLNMEMACSEYNCNLTGRY